MNKKGLGLALVLVTMLAAGCGDDKKADVTQPANPAPTKQATTDSAKDVVSKEVKPDGTIIEVTKRGTTITTDPKTGQKTYTSGNKAQLPTSTTEQIHQFPEGKK